RRTARPRAHGARVTQRRAPAPPPPRSDPGIAAAGQDCRREQLMRALVTGVSGFIGSTLAERLLERRADVVGIDCFTDYYPREIKERNLSGLAGRPAFRFIESTIQRADLPALLRDRTHVFHLAA